MRSAAASVRTGRKITSRCRAGPTGALDQEASFGDCSNAGSRNLKTLWKEAEKLVGTNSVTQVLDPLDVIETIMRYFYSLVQAVSACRIE